MIFLPSFLPLLSPVNTPRTSHIPYRLILTPFFYSILFLLFKERIEKMMQDLRGRVMNFLDDPSLEAVKVRVCQFQLSPNISESRHARQLSTTCIWATSRLKFYT